MNYIILYFSLIHIGLILLIYFFLNSYGNNPSELSSTEFDYIIVGSGTAGSVVASELAKTHKKILLLEAGPKPGIFFRALIDTPLLVPLVIGNDSSILWKYKTLSQRNSGAFMKNREMIVIGGKILGGSSMINAMISYKPSEDDFDSWGLPGWSFKDMRKYLDPGKYCGQRNIRLQEQSKFSNLNIALESLNGKYENGKILSFSSPHISYNRHNRISTLSDCLEKMENSKTVHIISDFEVNKIGVDKEKKIAMSVTGLYQSKNIRFKIKPGGKLILSAGSIEGARLLSQSLRDSQLPIGKNLQDHVIFGLYYHLTRTTTVDLKELFSATEIFSYILQRNSLFSIPNGLVSVGYLNSGLQNSQTPIVQLCIFGIGTPNHTTIKWLSNFQEKQWEDYLPKNISTNQSGFLLTITLLKPHSRGMIRFNSNRSMEIDPSYLSSSEDIEVMKHGISFITDKIKSSKYFQNLGAIPHFPKYADCVDISQNFDQYLDCAIRGSVISSYHFVGTNRIGKYDDKNSVVNPDLRVKGTKNMYVIDGSIIPQIPAGNPARMIITIAHKGAEILKDIDQKNTNKETKEPKPFYSSIFTKFIII